MFVCPSLLDFRFFLIFTKIPTADQRKEATSLLTIACRRIYGSAKQRVWLGGIAVIDIQDEVATDQTQIDDVRNTTAGKKTRQTTEDGRIFKNINFKFPSTTLEMKTRSTQDDYMLNNLSSNSYSLHNLGVMYEFVVGPYIHHWLRRIYRFLSLTVTYSINILASKPHTSSVSHLCTEGTMTTPHNFAKTCTP